MKKKPQKPNNIENDINTNNLPFDDVVKNILKVKPPKKVIAKKQSKK